MSAARLFWLLLLPLFLALASVYNATVPLGEGPDEPGHLRYVLFLAREGHLPVQRADPATSDVPGEGHQPPLAYALLLPAVAWLPPAERTLDQSANPAFLWSATGNGSDPAAFVRASRDYWPWQGVVLAWHLARAGGALLGALTLWCVWRAGCVCWPQQQGRALLAVGLVACNPQFLFVSALVTNDSLLITLSAALLWVGLGWLCTGDPRRAWLLGGLLGLALLTKQSALLLVPWLLWLTWLASGGQLARATGLALRWGGLALLLAGWWYARNWLLYGDPLGLAAFQATYATQPFVWHDAAAWAAGLAQLAASLWAYFGWMSLPAPTWVLGLYAALGLAGLAGGIATLRRAPWARWRLWLTIGLLPALALLWLVNFALVAGLVAWQGRLVFAALPALALLLAHGLAGWRLGGRAAAGLLAGLAALALWLPLGVIQPAYAWHTLPPATAQARIAAGHAAYGRFAAPWEQGIELRGWRARQEGATLHVTLTWHALERVPDDWTVFVHLVDANGAIVAEHNSRPRQGALPLPQWTPGDWLEDTHPLALPAALPPADYTLYVGLYLPWQRDPTQGRRQALWAADGTPAGDALRLGTLRLNSQP